MKWANWILICFLLTGCGVATPIPRSSPVAPPAETPTSSPGPTVTLSPTATKKPAATITSTLTPSATPLPTLQPLPTYLSPYAEQKIWHLLIDNGGCRLPCFWGITPGKTTEAEFLQFTGQFPNETEWMGGKYNGHYTFYYIPPYRTDTTFSVQFFVPNSIVEQVMIDSLTVPLSFPLTRLLQDYGMPDQVLVGSIESLESYGDMFILYEKQKILSRYILFPQDDYLCYSPKQARGIWIWAGEGSWLENVNRPFNGTLLDVGLKPLDQITEYDMDTFYEHFSTRNRDICMKTLEVNP